MKPHERIPAFMTGFGVIQSLAWLFMLCSGTTDHASIWAIASAFFGVLMATDSL